MIARRELVLVADDDQDIVRFVEVNLRLEGYEVATASDGEQALQGAYDLLPDLVLLDVMMPVLDGWQVAEKLLEDERTREIPIIFLTARAELRDRERGLEAGGIAYVTKPFNPLELAVLVEELVNRVARGEAKAVREERIAALRALVEGRPSDFDLKRGVG